MNQDSEYIQVDETQGRCESDLKATHTTTPVISTRRSLFWARRITLYRFRVVTQAQAGGYPSSLNSHVTHHVSIPIGQRPQSCQVLCPRDGKVELNLSMKLGRELLKPETFINSSLLAEVVDLLQVLAADKTISINGIGEIKMVSDTSTRAHVSRKFMRLKVAGKKKVPLELAPVGELLDNALSSQPIARLSSIDLELQYTPTGKKMNADHPATRSLTVTDFNSLIHVQPLVLPLKLSLKNFMKRFVRRNLLYQIPLVFNSEWRKVKKAEQVGYIFTWIMYAMLKTLESSIAYRQSISRSLVRIAKESISDDLRVELGKMPTKVSGKSLLHTTHKF
ncbi:hypothetical protein VP01_1935g7 [Puccinia sorghi]|uniref:Uncharacterized protein n=1 Tax=Puccinia sorghi TaxID=27349 RepID=A0A0L6VCY0_9BASI|nr:hypothetical protein VP01_1935g7 [Puccinia sorghi]